MEDMQLFVNKGFRVCYLWEHDWLAAKRLKRPVVATAAVTAGRHARVVVVRAGAREIGHGV
eukprot:3216294-Prymnesium_polylepis.1